MNIALVECLRSQPHRSFRPDELAARFHLPSDQVAQQVAELERFGFGIACDPAGGWRYLAPARRICPDQVEWGLGTEVVGRRIAYWQRVTSTNDVAARAAGSRSNHGLVVLAEEQTAGRGRRDRRWIAPAES